MDKWLVKMASKQPTSEESLEEALRALPIEELQKIAGDFSEIVESELEAPAPKTPNMDRMKSDIEMADNMGRELARKNGDALLKQANALAALKPIAGKALGLAAKHPVATMAGLGAAGGAVAGGPNNRLGGAVVGAGLGAGASQLRMGNSTVGANLANKAQGLSNKLTPGPFAPGGSVRAAVSDIGGRIRGAFGGGPTKVAAEYGEAEKAEHQRISRGHGRVGGAVGALTGGAAGLQYGLRSGSRPTALIGGLAGGALGAGLGYGASYLQSRAANRIARAVGGEGHTKLSFPGIHKMEPEEFESRFMSKMEPDKKEEFKKKYLTKKEKTASSVELMKLAYGLSCGPDGGDSWIKEFEGTPLLQEAIALERQSIETEMNEIQQRAEATRISDDRFRQQDSIRLKKRLLSLALAEQQIGGGGAGNMPPEGMETGAAEESIPPAGSPTPPQPQGEGQLKMAMRRIVGA